jgi:hypothetical protein
MFASAQSGDVKITTDFCIWQDHGWCGRMVSKRRDSRLRGTKTTFATVDPIAGSFNACDNIDCGAHT